MQKVPPGLYFIAIVPPSPLAGNILKLKEFVRDSFGSKASLRSPPHITLHMPFEWKSAREHYLVSELQRFAQTQKKFEVTLNDFGCFEPRVIFIAIAPNDSLKALEADLLRFCKVSFNIFNARYRDLPFHPHVTIAFRDLRKPMFHKAWEEFRDKSFNANFLVESIALLRHDGDRWNVIEEFRLS